MLHINVPDPQNITIKKNKFQNETIHVILKSFLKLVGYSFTANETILLSNLDPNRFEVKELLVNNVRNAMDSDIYLEP